MASAEFEGRDDAAEYALGTLDAAQRSVFEARMARDPALAAEVAQWQQRLGALNEETPVLEPPPQMLANIMERIGGLARDNVVVLKRRADLWRRTAIAVSAIAASLLVFVMVRTEWQAPQKGLYVAVLQGSGTAPAFVVAVDVKSKLIVVRSLGVSVPQRHSYELWALGAGRAAPQPLGIIDAVAHIPSGRLGDVGDTALADTTFAVSLEPPGGSPTGQPTGPVGAAGDLKSI